MRRTPPPWQKDDATLPRQTMEESKAAFQAQAEELAPASSRDEVEAAVHSLEETSPTLTDSDEKFRCRKNEIIEILLNEKKKFNKSDAMTLLQMVTDMEVEYIKMVREIEYLHGKLAERTEGKTYVSAASRRQVENVVWRDRSTSGKRLLPTKLKNKVVIRPKDKEITDSSEPTRAKIYKELKVSKTGIKVKAVRKTKSAAVIMEVATEQDVAKIQNDARLRDLNYEVIKPKRRKSSLIILSVDREIKKEEIAEQIYNQNDLVNKQTLEQFKKEIEPIFKTGPRDKPYCH